MSRYAARFLVSLTAEEYKRLETLARRREERIAVTARAVVVAALDEEAARNAPDRAPAKDARPSTSHRSNLP